MPHPKRLTKPIETIARPCITRPIVYHDALNDLQWAAQAMGWTAGGLRKASEKAIRTRNQQAVIEHESHKTHEYHIYCLTLSHSRSFSMYFTIEPKAIRIRGYAWNTVGEPLDDWDGGGIFW